MKNVNVFLQKSIALAKKHNKIIRFGIGGLISAAVEFLVFLLISRFAELYVASLVSFFCGLITSFLFNRFFVFRSNSKNTEMLTEIIKFAALGLLNSQISSWLTVSLSLVLGSGVLAKIITMGLIAIWNYVVMNKLIFKTSVNKKNKTNNKNK